MGVFALPPPKDIEGTPFVMHKVLLLSGIFITKMGVG